MSVFCFILFSILILAVSVGLNNLFTDFSKSARLLAWFLIICADIIIVLEIASLMGVFDREGMVLLIQAAISGIIVGLNIWLKIGFPKIEIKQWPNNIKKALHRLWKNKWLSIFGFLVLICYAGVFIISIQFPQTITDTLYNHLSRIGYWIQQGSLKHYQGFNYFGMIYPYNNSLLMTPGILFLRTAYYTGFIQFSAGIAGALAIYVTGKTFGFRRKSSAVAALIFLTYPVVIYESITAQNDLLVAGFITVAFAFQFLFMEKHQAVYLVLSALSFALAIGTNQYAFFAAPGYLGIMLYILIKNKLTRKYFVRWALWLAGFTLLVGSYSYIQNLIDYQSPFGPKGFVEKISNISNTESLLPRVHVNSSRLFSQFISCDGLPPSWADQCINVKTKILRPLLSSQIESEDFLYTGQKFLLTSTNVYNAESAWYGPVSWLLLLVSFVGVAFYAIKSKRFIILILEAGVVIFFYLIVLVKHGWDPYQGRYLMAGVMLIQPITAWIFNGKRFFSRVITILIGGVSLFIMYYAATNNYSLPIVSKKMAIDVELWGKEHCVLIQKVAYKVNPYLMYTKGVWDLDLYEIAAFSDHSYFEPMLMVQNHVGSEQALGIVAPPGFFMDFLFRGWEVRRPIYAFTDVNKLQLQPDIDFLLISPKIELSELANAHLVDARDGWFLYELGN